MVTADVPVPGGQQVAAGTEHSPQVATVAPAGTAAGWLEPQRNRRLKKLSGSRCACHVYVVHGLITVTGYPVTGSVVVAGLYTVTGTRFHVVRYVVWVSEPSRGLAGTACIVAGLPQAAGAGQQIAGVDWYATAGSQHVGVGAELHMAPAEYVVVVAGSNC